VAYRDEDAKDGKWCNYTVDVRIAGTDKIGAPYANAANTNA
jgi:hypothetical protein